MWIAWERGAWEEESAAAAAMEEREEGALGRAAETVGAVDGLGVTTEDRGED